MDRIEIGYQQYAERLPSGNLMLWTEDGSVEMIVIQRANIPDFIGTLARMYSD